jgi:hypothetical protein
MNIKNKLCGRVKRFSGIHAHTGRITLFSIPVRLTKESQKFIFTYPLDLEVKTSLAEEKNHNIPISTISNISDYSFNQSLR